MARILTRSGGSFDHKLAGIIRHLSDELDKHLFLKEKHNGKKTAYSAITMKKGE
jgi:hypothetical protein